MKWRIYLFRADKFDEERVKAMTDKQVMYAAWDMSCNIGGEEELVALPSSPNWLAKRGC